MPGRPGSAWFQHPGRTMSRRPLIRRRPRRRHRHERIATAGNRTHHGSGRHRPDDGVLGRQQWRKRQHVRADLGIAARRPAREARPKEVQHDDRQHLHADGARHADDLSRSRRGRIRVVDHGHGDRPDQEDCQRRDSTSRARHGPRGREDRRGHLRLVRAGRQGQRLYLGEDTATFEDGARSPRRGRSRPESTAPRPGWRCRPTRSPGGSTGRSTTRAMQRTTDRS